MQRKAKHNMQEQTNFREQSSEIVQLKVLNNNREPGTGYSLQVCGQAIVMMKD